MVAKFLSIKTIRPFLVALGLVILVSDDCGGSTQCSIFIAFRNQTNETRSGFYHFSDGKVEFHRLYENDPRTAALQNLRSTLIGIYVTTKGQVIDAKFWRAADAHVGEITDDQPYEAYAKAMRTLTAIKELIVSDSNTALAVIVSYSMDYDEFLADAPIFFRQILAHQ